jgi:hypothetical protein
MYDDVIYEAESALCNINKHYLQLKMAQVLNWQFNNNNLM